MTTLSAPCVHTLHVHMYRQLGLLSSCCVLPQMPTHPVLLSCLLSCSCLTLNPQPYPTLSCRVCLLTCWQQTWLSTWCARGCHSGETKTPDYLCPACMQSIILVGLLPVPCASSPATACTRHFQIQQAQYLRHQASLAVDCKPWPQSHVSRAMNVPLWAGPRLTLNCVPPPLRHCSRPPALLGQGDSPHQWSCCEDG